MGSRTLQVAHASSKFVAMQGQNSVPMSTHPVLLGRVTGLNVEETPKREGQAIQPGHVDIEVSPTPTVTRVTHRDGDRPSWTWRCVQIFIALLVVIFTTWLAIVIGSQVSWEPPSRGTPSYSYGNMHDDMDSFELIEIAALEDDPSCVALMVSTGIAGLAAMWLYLIAPTAHTLLAARFLCLNWVEGLLMLSSIAATKGDTIRYREDASVMLLLRVFLLLFEFLGLQFIIENRLQSLWQALNRPGCKSWLGRCLRMEVASLVLGMPSTFLFVGLHRMNVFNSWLSVADGTFLLTICSTTICFLIWIVLVTVTLFQVVLMFHKASKTARQQGLAIAATFEACRGRTILQCAGAIISLATSLMAAIVTGLCFQNWMAGFATLYGTIVPQCINLLVNAAGIILLSGSFNLVTSKGTLRFPPLQCCRRPRRFRGCCGFKSPRRSPVKIGEENDWEKKTRDLANRGISLKELLAFYKNLGDTVMQSFQPAVHTTTDVVRLAIIPMTAPSCSSYAQLVNKGEKVLPKKMITHNWSNLFRDVLASVISDALGEHTFEFIAELLSDKAGVEALEEMLRVQGSLQETYWICAFAVNQHRGICGANPSGTVDPVTGLRHPTCKCNEPKFFNKDPPLNEEGKSIQCEMNKFDDMMALLARENPDFAEVVAVDASLDLFGRAWCVAELAEGHRMGMAQSLKMRNKETLLRRQRTLQGLKVEHMKASRPEDVVEILAKIPDKEEFNDKLQELIFDSKVGLLTAWKDADALQQMEEVSHLLKWLRLSEAVEGHVVWQRWLP
eukprot:symbB.v1.2.035748.t1/scaffold4887.1/size33438/2